MKFDMYIIEIECLLNRRFSFYTQKEALEKRFSLKKTPIRINFRKMFKETNKEKYLPLKFHFVTSPANK